MLFERTLPVGWAQTDFNGHMRNSAYLDMCSDVRFMFFVAHGFPAARFTEARFGPVIQSDRVDYFREARLLDPLRVTLRVAGLAADGSRFRLQNDFYRPDGKLCASVVSTGGWLGLDTRRLIVPPAEIEAALAALERVDGFEALKPVRTD
ncbi:MAG TPA: thioesterase family protein [Woeseiaceae bacterium]|nr:thioesterase family protein [Woeseiaceae bacterium]